MRTIRSVITPAFVALAILAAWGEPSQADTGTVRVLIGTSGAVLGVGNGKGTLTLHGKTYPFEVSGASIGPTLTLTISELEGRALNLHTPGDSWQLYCGRSWWCHRGRDRLRTVAKREWGYLGASRPQAGRGALGQLGSRHHYDDVTATLLLQISAD